MLIPENVAEQLKTIDPGMHISDSTEGWITYLVTRINQGQQLLAQRVYETILDVVFTGYDSVSELLRTKAEVLAGGRIDQDILLFSRVRMSSDFVSFAIKVGLDPRSKQRSLLPRLFYAFTALKPAPAEWLNALTQSDGELKNADERTIATYWQYTEQRSECWHHAIRELERRFEKHPMRAQLLLSIALEKQREALKLEDPFKGLANI